MRFISLGYWKVKAVQCYLSLLIWLILVSIGLYWFLNRNGTGLRALNKSAFAYQDGVVYQDSGESTSDAVKSTKGGENLRFHPPENSPTTGRPATKISTSVPYNTHSESANVIAKLCNPPHSIKAGDENVQVPDFKLDSIIIIFRHGKRGPLTHIGHRNVSHISCKAAENPEYDELAKFATDTLLKLPGYSQFIGHFHSFPKVPTSPYCSLGQLSEQGSAQMLALGKLIRSTYLSTLVNFTTFNEAQQAFKVIAYSTRYRRTFQSLFAFLYGMVGPKQLIQSTTIHESQSLLFCFKHCSCKAVDQLKKVANKKFLPNQNEKAAMTRLVSQLNLVLGTEKSKKTGTSLLDSLLVYPCHNIDLPCHQDNQKATRVQLLFKTIKNLSLYSNHASSPSLNCVTHDHLKKLVKLINEENDGVKRIPESRQFHLLNAYGLLKEIVDIALKMTSSKSSNDGWRKPQNSQFISPVSAFTSFTSSNTHRNIFGTVGGKPGKIVVFSGHDTTLQSLTTALGIISNHPDAHLPPFGSRFIFEFYKKSNSGQSVSPHQLYFRVIYNGVSVTHLVSFCKEKVGYYATNKSDSSKTANENNFKANFCPIENLVRFIHENYFSSFNNTTNFRDACKTNL